MNMHNLLLGIAIVWPLLLAFPGLHSSLPWPRHLAILPAALLMLWPGDALLQVPWLLFGTGLSVDADTRWILGMSVILWLSAATLFKPNKTKNPTQQTSFFLMTLCGNLGVVLATDIITFFSFATLMSYSFYTLIIQQHDAPSRRAGRWYLICLILADLALFEAMLLAASVSEDLRYDLVRQEMTQTYSAFYTWMVVFAFALKSGIWPFYFWVTAAFKSSSQMTRVLLGGVPIAMGLLGLIRWIPIGEGIFYTAGIVFQLVGTMTVLHAALRIFKHGFSLMLTVWFAIAASGIFCIALGAALLEPALWQTYKNLSHPFIAILGVTLAMLSIMTEKFSAKQQATNDAPLFIKTLYTMYNNISGIIRQQTANALQNFQAILNDAYLTIINQCRCNSDKLEFLLSGWKAKITLFVLLGLAFAWLAK